MLGFTELFGWQFKNSKKEDVRAPFIKQNEEDAGYVVGYGGFGHNVYEMSLDQKFKDENELIKKYRNMAMHPEIDSAVAEIVNEAISGEIDEYPVSIVLDNIEGLSEKIKDKIRDEFKHILKLLEFNNKSYEIFRKWYIDGRIYYYMIPDEKNPKNGLVELRYMSPLWVKKVRQEETEYSSKGINVTKDIEEFFVYSPEHMHRQEQGLKIKKDSVCYISSGLYDDINNMTYSYLHKGVRPINQLRMLEDATIIYRLSRAPERRIFYVDVGNLPKGKADEYMKAVKNQLTNKMVYDSTSGDLKDQSENLSMMEDIWLPRKDGGRGTEVSTLQGGQNLGQIEDLEYFKRLLYMSLNVPYGRMAVEQQAGFSLGRSSEITREELKFSKFIQRLRKKFSKLFLTLLKTQLLLKQIITEDDWELLEEGIRFDYITDNYFKELKDAEILRERLSLLQEVDNYVGTYFSKSDVKKKILMMTDEEIEELEKQLEDEKESENTEDTSTEDETDGSVDVPEFK